MSTRRAAKAQIDAASPESARRTRPRTDRAPSSKVVKLRSADGAPAVSLGSGAHFAKLFRKLEEGRYEAQLMVGGRIEVGVAPEVDAELAELCLAEQQIVLIGQLGRDAVVFGALQTRAKKPEEVIVEAPRRLVLRSGKSKLVLSADGKIKLTGNDVTVDAPREVRLASARVEIP